MAMQASREPAWPTISAAAWLAALLYFGFTGTLVAQLSGPALSAPEASAPRQSIVDVKIVGNTATKEFEIQKHIQARKDREFDPEQVQGDVRRLVQTGLFRDVKTYTRSTPGGVVVIYEVYERPRIQEIKHLGNRRFSDNKLLKEHGLKKGDSINSYTSEEARRKVEELYHKNGCTNATVTLLEGDKPGDKNVIFVINEGQMERISKTVFEGNTIATDAQLKIQIQSKPGYFWYFMGGKVDREKIDADVEKVTAYYRSLGYFRARVSRDLQFDESGKWLTLKFIIDEGPRYIVRDVSIEGATKFAPGPVLDFLKLKSGDYFSQREMNRDISTLIDLYGSQGHVFADVQADPRFLEEPGEMNLIYRVKEGDVFTVGQIHVHIGGEFPHTRESVILNRLGNLRPGDLIDTREVNNAERRLKASQLFETNPQNGEPPRIVVRPPELNDIGAIASEPSRGGTIRGQSPEGPSARESQSGSSLPSQRTGSRLYSWGDPAVTPSTPATPRFAPARPQSTPYTAY